jgi:hypothetical protein
MFYFDAMPLILAAGLTGLTLSFTILFVELLASIFFFKMSSASYMASLNPFDFFLLKSA